MDRTVTIGRIVHYVHPEGCRPAMVVHHWGDNLVNLHVQASLTTEKEERPSYGRKDVTPGLGEGQWHWPDQCPKGL